METKKIDNILTTASVEDLMGMAQIARQAHAALVKLDGDSAGTWSIWSIIPERSPEWLWKMTRTGDSWELSLIAESLSLLCSDVRVTPSGKPFTNLLYYNNAGWVDNEVLIKWSNSSAARMDLVKAAIDAGNNIIGSARIGYEAERITVFGMVFEEVYKQYNNGEVPDTADSPIQVTNNQNIPHHYEEYETSTSYDD